MLLFYKSKVKTKKFVISVVEWLKHSDCDQHNFGSKPTFNILLCPWERHLMALFSAW